MYFTPRGILILVRLEQSMNACSSMLVTLLGMRIEGRLLHPPNAEKPMLLTPSGIVTLVKLPHVRKIKRGILVVL
jgi:hypothetical protein